LKSHPPSLNGPPEYTQKYILASSPPVKLDFRVGIYYECPRGGWTQWYNARRLTGETVGLCLFFCFTPQVAFRGFRRAPGSQPTRSMRLLVTD
jgi:hypothetical protein